MRSRSFNLSGWSIPLPKFPLTLLLGSEQDLTDAPCDHHGHLLLRAVALCHLGEAFAELRANNVL